MSVLRSSLAAALVAVIGIPILVLSVDRHTDRQMSKQRNQQTIKRMEKEKSKGRPENFKNSRKAMLYLEPSAYTPGPDDLLTVESEHRDRKIE